MVRVRRLLLLLASGCDAVFPRPREPPSDALADGAPPLIANCSELGLLADDFEDDLIPPWINERTTRFQLVGGKLTASLGGNVAIATTPSYFDVRNSSIQVRVEPSAMGLARLSLSLLPVPGHLVDEIAIQQVAGEVQIGTVAVSGSTDTFTKLRGIPAPSDMPIWRISYADGTATFAVVGDDGAELVISTLPIDLTYVRPRLRAESTEIATIAFDDVNGGTPRGEACSGLKLDDAFTAATLDLDRWGRSATVACTLTPGDGLALDVTGSNWVCLLGGTTVYDLLSLQLDIEVEVGGPLPPDAAVELSVSNAATQRAGFQILQGTRMRSFEDTTIANTPSAPVAGTKVHEEVYSPTQHRFWRITATRDTLGDQLRFSTSADGMTYGSFLQTGNIAGLDRAVVTFAASGPNPAALPIVVRGFRVVPQ